MLVFYKISLCIQKIILILQKVIHVYENSSDKGESLLASVIAARAMLMTV